MILAYKEMIAPMVKRFITDYQVTLGLLTVLSILLLWKLRNFMKLYEKFPLYPIVSQLTTAAILGKIPKNLSLTGFCFQRLVLAAKQFHNEEMFLIWIPRPFLFIFGADAVKILINEQAALDKSYKYDVLKESLGTGLITSNGETWKKNRKMLNPVFHVGILKNKVPIFNAHAQILVKKLVESVNESSIDVLKYIQPCSFGILSEYVLDLKMDSPENEELINNFIRIVKELGELIAYRFIQPWLHFKFMLNFVPTGRKYLRVLDEGAVIIRKIIFEMKNRILTQNANGNSGKETKLENDKELNCKSFAHILLEHHLKDPSFTMEDLEFQVATFMSAGFNTMSYALIWSIFMLGHHPGVQDCAYNEVLSISPEGPIRYEDLIKLKYLECVVKESLRLYPIIPVFARKISSDIQCGKYKLPKGTDIAFFSYMLHRNPELYPDPEKFDPERFQESNYEQRTGNYIPFSEGTRSCIGKRFAMMEMKVILTYILRNFRITSLDRIEDVNFCWDIDLRPTRPLQFRFTPRK